MGSDFPCFRGPYRTSTNHPEAQNLCQTGHRERRAAGWRGLVGAPFGCWGVLVLGSVSGGPFAPWPFTGGLCTLFVLCWDSVLFGGWLVCTRHPVLFWCAELKAGPVGPGESASRCVLGTD